MAKRSSGRLALMGLAALSNAGWARAEDRLRFWNTTTVTITSLQFAEPGTKAWGANQCENDTDKSVSSDERLRLTGVKPGRYDLKLADTTGRICTVRDVELKAGGKYALSLGNDDLKDCSK